MPTQPVPGASHPHRPERPERPMAPGVGVGLGVLVCRTVAGATLVLVGRRQGAHGAGTWALPGGKLDFGETPADGAARELAEETGLRALALQPGPWVSTVFPPEPGRPPRHDLTLFLQATVAPDAEPRRLEPDKCEGWHWHRWDALPQPLFAPLQALVDSGWRP